MIKQRKIEIILGVVCIVLTFAICVQLKTTSNASQVVSKSFTEDKLRDEVLKWKEKYDNVYSELEKAEVTLDNYRNKASQTNLESANTEEELKLANNLLGLTELTGKGVIVTLEDNKSIGLETLNISDYLVHATDIVELVNDLKNAGAEAISINGQRVINATGVVCDGNVVRINDQKIGAPYTIRAIGQPEYLYSSLNMPGGYIQRLNSYGVVTKVEKSNNIVIPKYSGVYNSTNLKSI